MLQQYTGTGAILQQYTGTGIHLNYKIRNWMDYILLILQLLFITQQYTFTAYATN